MTTAVLITGTSSGIGRATAQLLVRRCDLTVYATARRLQSLRELTAAGARTLALDVTDDESMRAAVTQVEAEHGAVA
jgi:NADP-dependent 3-hydroxy acid dehydrogenase YdfG